MTTPYNARKKKLLKLCPKCVHNLWYYFIFFAFTYSLLTESTKYTYSYRYYRGKNPFQEKVIFFSLIQLKFQYTSEHILYTL